MGMSPLPVELLAMASSSRASLPKSMPLPLNFFTPSRKGKERAFDPEFSCPKTLLRALYPQWSCAAKYPIVLDEEHMRATSRLMSREFMTKWDPPPIRSSRSIRVSHLSPPSALQRRHASHSSKPRVAANNSVTPTRYSPSHSQVLDPSLPQSPEPSSNPSPLSLPGTLPSSSPEQHAYIDEFHQEKDRPGHLFDIERAYTAFIAVEIHDLLRNFTVNEFLSLATKMVVGAENDLFDSAFNASTLQGHAEKILHVLATIERRIDTNRSHYVRFLYLRARCLSLQGHSSDATETLLVATRHRYIQEHQEHVYISFKAIIVGVWKYHGKRSLLEYLVSQWSLVGPFLGPESPEWKRSPYHQAIKSLRSTTHSLLQSVTNPEEVLEPTGGIWHNANLNLAARLLLDVYLGGGLPLDALRVLKHMEDISVPLSVDDQLRVLRGLVKQRHYRPANTLFASMPSQSRNPFYLHAALYLVARQGDSERAQSYFDELSASKWTNDADIIMLLYSHATKGDTERTIQVFDFFFPPQSDGTRRGTPSLEQHNIVLYAFAQCGDTEGLSRWLNVMSGQDVKPDLYSYNTIMKSFALRGDMESMSAILDQMKNTGIATNRVTYTTIITILSHRKQVHLAEHFFRRALSEGILPDRRMFAAIMDAHVSAGSWKGVIRAFDFLRISPRKQTGLTINEYNLILRAYLFIGAPFPLIARLFGKLEQAKILPNRITYQILLQSACETGRMDIASKIFTELEELQEREKGNHFIDSMTCTTIMAGFLRTRDRRKAKAVYDDMLSRGLQPTASTYNRILSSYASSRTQESLELVEDFVANLTRTPQEQRSWNRPSYGRLSALSLIYSPLLRAYDHSPQDVERLYEQYLEEGGEPELGPLTTLLHAHRRAFNIEGAPELWEQIFQLGKLFSKHVQLFPDDPVHMSRSNTRSDVISIPLSIYLDVLSASGMHAKVADVWREYEDAGFVFTSHNWNHLCVALLRAGEVKRAFSILQKVILPYHHLSRAEHSKERDRTPSSPLTFDVVDDGDYQYHSPLAPVEPPLGDADRRKDMHRYFRGAVDKILEDKEYDEDIVQPLYLLHQMSPSWNTWRAHRATKIALLRALERLKRGKVVEPVPSVEEQQSGRKDSVSTEETQEQAFLIANEIYEESPAAADLIDRFSTSERGRLGVRYTQRYIDAI